MNKQRNSAGRAGRLLVPAHAKSKSGGSNAAQKHGHSVDGREARGTGSDEAEQIAQVLVALGSPGGAAQQQVVEGLGLGKVVAVAARAAGQSD